MSGDQPAMPPQDGGRGNQPVTAQRLRRARFGGPPRGRQSEFSRVIVDHCAAFLAACAFSLRSLSSAALSSSSLIVSLSNLPVNRNGGR